MSDKINPERGAGLTLPALALTRAGGNTKPAPASVYLLADHLDTVLAAAEDIVNARLTWNSARRAGQLKIAEEKHSFRDDIEEIRKLENTIIIRVLKSRERAEDVARADKRFRQLAKLYVAGTAVLLDAVEECGDSTDIDFATADSIPAYLRSRGLVDPDAPAPDIGENLQVGEDFLIAKRIAAGPLMDLAAALLDALELHYDLFLDENELAMAPQINRFEDEPAVETQEGGARQPKDSELEAAIEDVRDAASQQPDTSMQPDIWAKMSSAGSVLAPVVSPPAPEPLVVVSKTEVIEDVLPQSAGEANEDVSDDDVPTEIGTTAFESNQAETPDADVVEDIEPSASEDSDPTSDALASKQRDEDSIVDDSVLLSEASDADTVSAEPQPSDDSNVIAIVPDNSDEDDEGVDGGLEADAQEQHEEESSSETEATDNTDDSLIITAANDDDGTDGLDDADASDSNDDAIALVADNTDTEPDAVEADSTNADDQDDIRREDDVESTKADSTADIVPEIEAGSKDEVHASDEAGAEDDTSEVDKKKKSKSLLGRLSLIKS